MCVRIYKKNCSSSYNKKYILKNIKTEKLAGLKYKYTHTYIEILLLK